MGCEIGHLDGRRDRAWVAADKHSAQAALEPPLKRAQQNVDSSSASDEEQYLGERHGARRVYTLLDIFRPPGHRYRQGEGRSVSLGRLPGEPAAVLLRDPP